MTPTRRVLLVVATTVLAAGLVTAGVLAWGRDDASSPGRGPVASSAATSPAPSPEGTPAPPAAADPGTTAPAEPTTDPGGADDGATPPTVVTVTVTFAAYDDAAAAVVVGGYADTVERGGTCTLVLRSGDVERVATLPAEPDATSTSCGGLSLPRAELSTGSWSAVLTYASPTSFGTAPSETIEVP